MNIFLLDVLLGTKLIWRERHRDDFKIFMFALSMAALCMTVLNILNAAAWKSMYVEAVRAYGADLVIDSHVPIPTNIYEQAKRLNLKVTKVNTLLTMASSGESFQLVSLKSVGEGYPLQGEVKISNEHSETSVSHGPIEGTVWVEGPLLSALNMKLGDTLKIGEADFQVTHILVSEPDAANSLFIIAPRVMMGLPDLSKTEVIQAGSRVDYQVWISGSNISAFKNWVEDLRDPNLELQALSKGRSPIQRFLGYAQSYLGLIIILIVVLAGLSLSLCARFWVKARLNAFSLYKVLGASPNRLLRLVLSGLFVWGSVLIVMMICLGFLSAIGILKLASFYFPQLVISYELWPLSLTFLISFFILVGFTLPEIWLTRNILPIHILQARPLKFDVLWMFYGCVGLGCIVILYYYTQNLHLTLIIAAGIGWAVFIAYLLLWGFIGLLQRVPKFTLPFSLAVRQLSHQRGHGSAQAVSLTLLITVMLLLYGIRTDFLYRWQAQLPQDTPNHFMINIAPFEVESLKQDLEEKMHQDVSLFPIVRGRLTHINGVEVKFKAGDPGPRGIDRPLNLTWMKNLPEHNKIIEGKSWSQDLKGQTVLSIEAGFAKRLKVALGDRLTFLIENRAIEAQIYNIREVTWQSFEPNFFVIYPEGVIDDFASTYMGSFYIPPNKKDILPHIYQTFPEVTIIEVDKIIDEIQTLLDLLVKGIEGLLWVVFLFALLILYVILSSSKPIRKRHAALLKLVGGTKVLLQVSTWYEYLLLGLMAGLVGSCASFWMEYELGKRIFDLSVDVPYMRYLLTTCLSGVLLGFFGLLSMQGVHKQAPLSLLRA